MSPLGRRAGGALLAAGLLLPAAAAATPDDGWVVLETTPARTDTPLSGFLPFAPEPGDEPGGADSGFPHTMEWFYLPVADVVTGEDQYDWSALESWLDSIAGRGHQSVLRFYLDYPGLPSGVPAHLLGEGGIDQSRRYDVHDNDGVSFSPDYDDPRVLELLTAFVAAFGERYDGDSRLGFVTTGLVGFWGEQHTWPLDGERGPENPSGADWMPGEGTQERLLAAWDTAFDTTRLLVRYPSEAAAAHAVGLHDDSFAYETLPTQPWHFASLTQTAGLTERWRTEPVGGELYPALQICVFSTPPGCADDAEDVAAATEVTHASWLVNDRAWSDGYDGADRERALEAHAALGPDIAALAVRTGRDEDGRAEVTVRLTNRGVAPFYADWPGELAVLDDGGEVSATAEMPLDLPSLQPGEVREVTASIDGDGARLALAVPNPMSGGAPLRLANAGQDAHASGYLTLGDVPPAVAAAGGTRARVAVAALAAVLPVGAVVLGRRRVSARRSASA